LFRTPDLLSGKLAACLFSLHLVFIGIVWPNNPLIRLCFKPIGCLIYEILCVPENSTTEKLSHKLKMCVFFYEARILGNERTVFLHERKNGL
jgi:hypothetical protein